jgi:hypothetical protein
MNNNIIQQLVHFLTNGWQNPLPGMGKTFQQTGQNLQNTYWGQTPKPTAIPTPTPHVTVNSPWQVVNTANLPKQMPTSMPTPTQIPPQMPQQTLGAQTSQLSSYEQQAAAIFQQYGINPQVGLSILKAEGGRIGTNNPGNINATDSNPTGAYNYATPQAGLHGAAQTMRRLLDKQGIKSNDPNMQLQGIEQGGYAGDPKTWRQRSIATGGAGKQYPSWSSFVKATPVWNTWSQGGHQ